MITELKTIQSIHGLTSVTEFKSADSSIIQIGQDRGFIQLDVGDLDHLLPLLTRCRREHLLSKFHTGTRVLYVPMHAYGDVTHQDCERGTVSSKNDVNVFVKFDNKFMNGNSKACSPEDLNLL